MKARVEQQSLQSAVDACSTWLFGAQCSKDCLQPRPGYCDHPLLGY